jgi:hypothetical protein
MVLGGVDIYVKYGHGVEVVKSVVLSKERRRGASPHVQG